MNFSKYIGRDYETYNCLDLVREFYKDQFDLDVKNYFEGEIPSREEVCSLIKTNKGDFVEVSREDVRMGDIVVIRLYGIECHLGVMVTKNLFLHSARIIGSNLDRIERYSKMIAGYFRHRELADDKT